MLSSWIETSRTICSGDWAVHVQYIHSIAYTSRCVHRSTWIPTPRRACSACTKLSSFLILAFLGATANHIEQPRRCHVVHVAVQGWMDVWPSRILKSQ